MSIWELLLIALGLAMDAFAVSVCKGLSLKNMQWSKAAVAGAYFGGFQFIMPVIGFYLAYGLKDAIMAYDHWVAFALLVVIGIGMIKSSGDEVKRDDRFGWKVMLPLAVATSIDAMAVGVSLAFLGTEIWFEGAVIGVVTFLASFAGVKIGNACGSKYSGKAEILGGVILIAIGIKILLEHTGLIG